MKTVVHEPVRVRKFKKFKRIKFHGDIPLDELEARIEELAEEDLTMTLYERGVEIG